MKKLTTKKLVLSGLFLALGLMLPFLTAQIPSISNKLLPMHLPVLLCSFIVGWPYGLAVGFITPILRSALFTMPPMFPTATAMAFELAAYGCIAGLVYEARPNKDKKDIYVSLIIAMLGGRVVWGIVSYILYSFVGNPFTWKFFIGGAFINAIPGIIVQLILIPIIVSAIEKSNVTTNA